MDELISRKGLLEAYDNAHKGPPGNARRLIEEAPAVISDYEDADMDIPFAVSALLRATKKKVNGREYALPVYDGNGCKTDVLFMYKAHCPHCGYVIFEGEAFEPFDNGEFNLYFCQKCGQALDWSDVE